MTEAQKVNALLSNYIKLYKEKYKKDPSINRYKDRWGFKDMLADLGEQSAYKTLEYYFETSRPGHQLVQLFRNYDELNKRRLEKIEDAARRADIMQRTKKVVEEENARRAGLSKRNM